MEFSIRMFLPNGAGPQALQRSRCFLEATGCYGSPHNLGQDSGQFDLPSISPRQTCRTQQIWQMIVILLLVISSLLYPMVSNGFPIFGPGALTPWMPFTVPLLCAPIRSTTLWPAWPSPPWLLLAGGSICAAPSRLMSAGYCWIQVRPRVVMSPLVPNIVIICESLSFVLLHQDLELF